MKKTLLIVLSALVAGSQMANADEPAWYGSLNFGVALPDGEMIREGANAVGAPGYALDNGNVVGAAAGYAFGNGLRLEGELRAREFDADGRAYGAGGHFSGPARIDGTAKSTTLMMNLAYDFMLKETKLRPFVKAGLGVAWNKAEADLFDVNGLPGWRGLPSGADARLAWSVGAGAAYPLSDRWSLTAEYQYIDLGSAETDSDIYSHRVRFEDFGSHEVTFGLRYTF